MKKRPQIFLRPLYENIVIFCQLLLSDAVSLSVMWATLTDILVVFLIQTLHFSVVNAAVPYLSRDKEGNESRKYESHFCIDNRFRFPYASSIACPISWRIYLLAKSIHSVALYALARASFRSLPFAVTPSTRPPFVTMSPSSSNFVPAWNT